MIKMYNLDPAVQQMVRGLMLGDVFFVNGSAGDDHATGVDQDHAVKTLAQGVAKGVTGHHDYILGFGSETLLAAIAVAVADLHIIGIGNGGAANEFQRGWQLTRAVTVDGFQPTADADRLEIAGISFIEPATDAILIDDAGLEGGFFHHNTIIGSTTASDAIRLDLEGPRWTINDNIFVLCKLAIDVVGKECVIRRNEIQDVDTGAKGVVIGAAAHRCIVAGNDFNLSGGTGDIGITVTAGAVNCQLKNNTFDDGISDPILDGGTGTHMVGNVQSGLAGTSGASLPLSVE